MLRSEKGSVSVLVASTIIFLLATIVSAFVITGLNREYQLKRQLATKELYEEQVKNYYKPYAEVKGKGYYNVDESQFVNYPSLPSDGNNTKAQPVIFSDGAFTNAEAFMTPSNVYNITIDPAKNGNDWYRYSSTDQRYANIKLTGDNSYWVWIPRFAYKQNYSSKIDSNLIVVFLIGSTNKYIVTNGVNEDGSPNYVVRDCLADGFSIPNVFSKSTTNRGFWIKKYNTFAKNYVYKFAEHPNAYNPNEPWNYYDGMTIPVYNSGYSFDEIGYYSSNILYYSMNQEDTAGNSHQSTEDEKKAVCLLRESQYGLGITPKEYSQTGYKSTTKSEYAAFGILNFENMTISY